MSTVLETVSAAVLVKLRKVGSQGALAAELNAGTNACNGTLYSAMKSLQARGLIDSHSHPGRSSNNRRRWYLVEHKPASAPKAQHVEPGFTRKRGPVAPEATSIDASRAKVTVVPGWTHDARFQLAPGERVIGGFASMGVGRYLEGEGRA